MADDFATELAKQLPVRAFYDDALSPAAKQVGQFGQDLLKVIQLAVAPVQYVAALQDRYRQFLDKSVRRVPEENRVAPPPQILGPVLEGVRYETEGTPIDEMFSQLLSSAMDSRRVNKAHPAYPIIIRQLSADEAHVLNRMLERHRSGRKAYLLIERYTTDDSGEMYLGGNLVELDEFPRQGLMFPHNLGFYMSHLNQLGLAALSTRKDNRSDNAPPHRLVREYALRVFGFNFMEACHPN